MLQDCIHEISAIRAEGHVSDLSICCPLREMVPKNKQTNQRGRVANVYLGGIIQI